ncbi:MAG TPA: patatin-like phospholipase family protein [Acidimicrobiales bacterium]|nr:patatin-like phospholipase family protein [Acidimicrobiales bacterium]
MTDARTAFVLAGGGAKGAFEAGAVRYLVEELCLTPDVITAASAGALAGGVLAQARSLEEFQLHTRQLRDDLLAMTDVDTLFGRQPWVEALQGTPLGRVIDEYVTERTRPPIPGDEGSGATGVVPSGPAGRRRPVDIVSDALKVLPALPKARRGLRTNRSSLLTLDPLARALRAGGPTGIHALDPTSIGRPGLDLRLAVTALRAGVVRYVTERGVIVESDALTPVPGPGGGPVDIIEGMLASASVPMVFAPRPLADDVYVDGGVVQNIPVEAAVRLGATRVIAILAVPLVAPVDTRDFSAMDLVGLFLRAVGDIAFMDRQRTNLAYPLPAGASLTVIDPVVDVVGPFEVSPGLMVIDMDYGWLRAADVLADVDEPVRQSAAAGTDALVTARTRAWHHEETLWRAPRVGAGDLAELRQLKDAVRDALDRRQKLGLAVPLDTEPWWSGYERHLGSRPPGLPEHL